MVGWIKMPLGMEVGLVPGDIVLDRDWEPSSPHGKGHSSPHNFQPMSIVAKRSPVSATAELLLYMFYFSTPLVLWHCWLGGSKFTWPVNNLCTSSQKVLLQNSLEEKDWWNWLTQLHLGNGDDGLFSFLRHCWLHDRRSLWPVEANGTLELLPHSLSSLVFQVPVVIDLSCDFFCGGGLT